MTEYKHIKFISETLAIATVMPADNLEAWQEIENARKDTDLLIRGVAQKPTGELVVILDAW